MNPTPANQPPETNPPSAHETVPQLSIESIDGSKTPDVPRRRVLSLNRRAILFSLAVNLLIIVVLGIWYFRPGEPKDFGDVLQQETARGEKKLKSDPPPAQNPTAEPELKPLPGEKAQQTVERVLLEKTKAVKARTPEENRQELTNHTDKLNKLSDEESVDQMARQFQKWFNTPTRQTTPSNVPPVTADTVTTDNFDAESAQFHDVLRTQTDSGRYAYQAVLIDNQGRSMILDMSESDGKQMYETMQKIKANPLLDKVYRQIIMPIIDKELKKSAIQNSQTP